MTFAWCECCRRKRKDILGSVKHWYYELVISMFPLITCVCACEPKSVQRTYKKCNCWYSYAMGTWLSLLVLQGREVHVATVRKQYNYKISHFNHSRNLFIARVVFQFVKNTCCAWQVLKLIGVIMMTTAASHLSSFADVNWCLCVVIAGGGHIVAWWFHDSAEHGLNASSPDTTFCYGSSSNSKCAIRHLNFFAI